MSLILTIDTATSQASVSLSFEGKLLAEKLNSHSMDHAAWLHVAARELLQTEHHYYTLQDLSAVAAVAGPGSYTGLRVGMSAAKGLCYALQIPLISLNTLKAMADATNQEISSSQLLCPMLDARRMEVFAALYDASLQELIPPSPMILEKDSFSVWLNKHEIIFFGSGSSKWKSLTTDPNALFAEWFYKPADLAKMSYKAFLMYEFSDLAYAEPFYLKDFYSPVKAPAQP